MIVTLKDIARRAEVSPSTVSLVLSDKVGQYRFAPETVANVRRIADEMGYRPNRTATVLRHQKTHLIGFMAGGYRMQTQGQLLEGLHDVFQNDYGLLSALHNFDMDGERDSLNYFIDSRVSGVVAFWSGVPENIQIYQELVNKYKIPLIVMDRPIPDVKALLFLPDDHEMAFMATQAVIDMGHKDVLYVPYSSLGTSVRKYQVQGYTDAMKDNSRGDKIDCMSLEYPVPVLYSKEYEKHIKTYTREIVSYCLGRSVRPTALVVQDDLLAYEVLFQLREAGVRVPEDMSVIGMGNRQPSGYSVINLSSVGSQSFVENGRIIARLLLEMINGEEVGSLYYRPLGLFLRGTTAELKL